MEDKETEKKIAHMEKKIGKLFYEILTIKNKKNHGVTDLILLEDRLNELEIKVNYLGGNK
tara:strand:+ start:725 stop:904 length:180 start_codon:yes stop_codon:yes gene_type:complete